MEDGLIELLHIDEICGFGGREGFVAASKVVICNHYPKVVLSKLSG